MNTRMSISMLLSGFTIGILFASYVIKHRAKEPTPWTSDRVYQFFAWEVSQRTDLRLDFDSATEIEKIPTAEGKEEFIDFVRTYRYFSNLSDSVRVLLSAQAMEDDVVHLMDYQRERADSITLNVVQDHSMQMHYRPPTKEELAQWREPHPPRRNIR